MTGFLERPSVSGVRRLGRILGTLLGLLSLAVFFDWVMGPNPPTAIRDYLFAVVLLLIISGCVVGWFKDLPAAVLILGAFLLILVTALVFPGSLMRVYFLAIPAIPGLLYLYVHLASKKK